MYLIVGLGNPEKRYEFTRHNFGFLILDFLADHQEWEAKYDSLILKLDDVILAKPQTYMNHSGKAVAQIKKYYPEAELIVIHDELDLPLGAIRIGKNNSAAGHNGVQSIIDELGTADFIRIRLGINSPARGQISGEAFVLQNFHKDEESIIKEVLEKAAAAVETIQTEGLDIARSKFNG